MPCARRQNSSSLFGRLRDIGCKVILVCGVQLRANYADKVSAILTCIGSPSKLASWSIGAIVVADLLAYGVAVRNQQQATDAKKRLADLRDQALRQRLTSTAIFLQFHPHENKHEKLSYVY